MSDFEDIRPYSDAEVGDVLQRLINEPELVQTILEFRFGHWASFLHPFLAWCLRLILRRKASDIKTVSDLQNQIEVYMRDIVCNSTDQVEFTGIENLAPNQPHLFISNHRDIVLDPGLINLALHERGIDTMRIAIGDNLLGKDWIADLMRLNKSFVVKRSVKTIRQKLMASKQLSKYMYLSVTEDASNIWIAQREGRAKDGNDFSNPAVLSMLLLNKPKTMLTEDYVKQLRIVPVSISYEYDPCDIAKANELQIRATQGKYDKEHSEDLWSIAEGMQGEKGRVAVHFHSVLTPSDTLPLNNAKAVSKAIEYHIIRNYVIMPTNIAAAQLCYAEHCGEESASALGKADAHYCTQLSNDDLSLLALTMSADKITTAKAYLQQRLATLEPDVRQKAIYAYAAPVFNKLALLKGQAERSTKISAATL